MTGGKEEPGTSGAHLEHPPLSPRWQLWAEPERARAIPVGIAPTLCHHIPGSAGGGGTRDQLARGEGRATDPLQSNHRPATLPLARGDGKLCLSRGELAGVTAHRHAGDARTQHQPPAGMGPRGAWMSLPAVPGGFRVIVPHGLSRARKDHATPPRAELTLSESRARLRAQVRTTASTKCSPLGCTVPKK